MIKLILDKMEKWLNEQAEKYKKDKNDRINKTICNLSVIYDKKQSK